jgi:integrase
LHDCGHYLASTLIDKGTGLTVVQAQMRHASLSTTTRTCAHLMEGAADEARAALGDEYRPRAGKQPTRESS